MNPVEAEAINTIIAWYCLFAKFSFGCQLSFGSGDKVCISVWIEGHMMQHIHRPVERKILT